jgi:hypothetical protein
MSYSGILTLTTVAASCFLLSCQHEKNSKLTIPKDASTIVRFNGASIAAKANWKTLVRSGGLFQQTETPDAFDNNLMENPQESGIDLKSDIIYFTKKQGYGGYAVLEGRLTDASAFEKIAIEKSRDKKIQTANGFQYIQTGHSNLLTWTRSKFIYITNSPSFKKLAYSKGKQDASPDSLKKYASDVYDLESSNSMETDERYAALLKEPGDLHFWTNTAQAMAGIDLGPLALMSASPLMQGSVTTAAVRFENGKILITSRQYVSGTLAQILEKHRARALTRETLSHLSPASSVVVAMNYEPQVLSELLSAGGAIGTVNSFFKEMNYSADEFIRTTKGELLIAAEDLAPAKFNLEAMDENPLGIEGKFLVAASVNNDSSIKKLETALTARFPTMNTRTSNNWFVAGNSPQSVNSFFSTAPNSFFADKIAGRPFGLYMDIPKALALALDEDADSSDIQRIEEAKKIFETVVITGGEYSNGGMAFETTISFADKSTNSLEQMSSYWTELLKIKKMNEPLALLTARPSKPKQVPYVSNN